MPPAAVSAAGTATPPVCVWLALACRDVLPVASKATTVYEYVVSDLRPESTYSRVAAATVSTGTYEPGPPSDRITMKPSRPVSSPPSASCDGALQRTTIRPTVLSSATADTL